MKATQKGSEAEAPSQSPYGNTTPREKRANPQGGPQPIHAETASFRVGRVPVLPSLSYSIGRVHLSFSGCISQKRRMPRTGGHKTTQRQETGSWTLSGQVILTVPARPCHLEAASWCGFSIFCVSIYDCRRDLPPRPSPTGYRFPVSHPKLAYPATLSCTVPLALLIL